MLPLVCLYMIREENPSADSNILDLDIFSLSDRASNNMNSSDRPNSDKNKSQLGEGSRSMDSEKEETEDAAAAESDNEPLFFQPGKRGFYSLRPGKNSADRLNCFRNVGRLVKSINS